MKYLMLVCWDAENMDAQAEPDPTDTPEDEGFPWLDDLQARGFIDHQRVADSVVNRRGAKLGAMRIKQELQAKGLDAQLVNQTVAQLRGSEIERARDIWRKKFDAPPADAKLRRRAKGGRLRPDPGVPLTEYPLDLRSSSHMRSERIPAVAHDVRRLDNCAEKCGARQTDQAPV